MLEGVWGTWGELRNYVLPNQFRSLSLVSQMPKVSSAAAGCIGSTVTSARAEERWQPRYLTRVPKFLREGEVSVSNGEH